MKDTAASLISSMSFRVEPEVSSSKAISKGASVVAKSAIFCGWPFSKSLKVFGSQAGDGAAGAVRHHGGNGNELRVNPNDIAVVNFFSFDEPESLLEVCVGDCSSVVVTRRGRC